MSDAPHVSLDPDIFERNLSALQQADPGLADRLAGARAADGGEREAIPARTRDGRVSLRIPRLDGGWAWLGRTTVPSVRAAALVERFDTGPGNVMLAGIGEGSELALLSRWLGRHRAIFVWEPEEIFVRLVLRLHDVAESLTDGRIVFLCFPLQDLAVALAAWLEQHPGYLCPQRIMIWPWQSASHLGPCQLAVESAFQESERVRTSRLAEQLRVLSVQPCPSARKQAGAVPRTIAVCALHAQDETWCLGQAMADGALELGWQPVQAVVRTPADVHPLARASRLADAGRPDLALLIDVTHHEVRDILPDNVPSVCWLGPRATIDGTLRDRAGGDSIAVTSGRLSDRVIACGIEPRRLSVLPPPCLASLDRRGLDADHNRPLDVVILADLAPTGPASYGHRLTTHVTLWSTVLDLLKGRIETLTDDQVGPLVAEAERKLGIQIEDDAFRQAAVEALSTSVAGSILWHFIAQSLLRKEVRLAIAGSGWPEMTGAQMLGPLPTVDRRRDVLERSRVLVWADVTGAVSVDLLLAAGSGAAIVARRHPAEERPGGLLTVLRNGEEVLTFSRSGDLVSTVFRLLADEGERRRIADAARERCRVEHRPANRLTALRAVASSFSTHPTS